MRLSFIQRQTFLLLFSLLTILFVAGCDGDSITDGGGGGGCIVANCFGGGGSGGGSQNPNLSISVVPGDRQNKLTFALTSGSATSFNIYWSTSPDTTTPTWNKIEGVASPFTHTDLTNGIPRFYGVTAVSGGSESEPSAVVGAMPGKWTQLNPLIAPPARDSHTAVYNPTTDRMIVFGGKNQTTTFQDLWILSKALGNPPVWESPTTIVGLPPSSRASHTAIYNERSNKMVVFGGSGDRTGSFNSLTNDLWLLLNTDANGVTPNWLPLFPSGSPPPTRWGHAAVYDEQKDIMVVFGGVQTGVTIFNDIWVLEGAANQLVPAWRQILIPPSSGPSARCCMAVGYDSANRRMIMFGGFGGSISQNPILFGDLWTLTFDAAFTTATWRELTPSGGTAPSARCCAASVWDGSKFLLFGGGTFNNSSDDKIYALVLQNTTFATADGPSGGPPARTFATAVPAGHFLLFGGTESLTPFNDLWRLD